MKTISSSYPMPQSLNEWLSEIADAYYDAYESIPFGKYVGQKITEKDLFHMTPEICIKFRGIKRSRKEVKRITEGMLASYIATECQTKGIFKNPHISFCFGFLVSHFLAGLLTDKEVTEIMDYMEHHQAELTTEIKKRITRKTG